MARQRGIIPIEGTIGNITFFKTKDGYMAKEKTSLNASQIATSPSFERTRENNEEFGRAGTAGKLLRTAFRAVIQNASDGRMVSRLTAEMLKVIRLDAVSLRGKRNVLDGELELLQGFECNINDRLSTCFFAPYTTTLTRADGTLAVAIPPFVPNDLIAAPTGATHFKIVSAGSAIDFENSAFESDTQVSGYLPLNGTLTTLLTLTNTVTANNSHPLFLALGIEFLQEVNGEMYQLNGNLNAMAIVKIEGI